ncbi:hypothetical protein [Nonomuraea sp. NPDC050643]|uniref:hypothetical protein n=1 Tax=Nonomuraea sp. NPDC050643 TaxID=3155660 RepID=UPI0033CED27F
MTSTGPQKCPRCSADVVVARLLGSSRTIVLNAETIAGGDYTIWANGNMAGYTWIGRARPAQVRPPKRGGPAVWDGRAEANRRLWWVEHQHNKTSQQILQMRESA